ncbi:hypothetical protein GOEFS_119_00190 [Gordonia effusa NBRC 100432]|uniref:Uncharacterized protein n=1 Tax=Gordonia effusa NBRC 100432 TaxID=1077974 RepID=H0R628_9ACTN|nr:hypothetical protein [Gordonia effusa]GAB20529.1 hypothetical protein GOEFS_119_00190 [Gordonia effusa NBRC 100432]
MSNLQLILADDSLFGTGNHLIQQSVTLLTSAGSALGMYFVIKHLIESFTVVRLVMALLLAGLMIYGITNLSTFSSKWDKTVNSSAPVSPGYVVNPTGATQVSSGARYNPGDVLAIPDVAGRRITVTTVRLAA